MTFWIREVNGRYFGILDGWLYSSVYIAAWQVIGSSELLNLSVSPHLQRYFGHNPIAASHPATQLVYVSLAKPLW